MLNYKRGGGIALFKNEKGFTLIEILSVIAIIAILYVVFAPNLNSLTQGSRINVVETDFRTMKAGIQQHYIDNREAPFTEKEIKRRLDVAFVKVSTSNGVDKYETKTKLDPWGRPYYMYVNNTGSRYVLLQSYGPDEQPGVDVATSEFGDDIVFIFYPKN